MKLIALVLLCCTAAFAADPLPTKPADARCGTREPDPDARGCASA
jgi:hypothetical protein